MADEKKFPASAKKLREARKRGETAKSNTLTGAVTLSACIIYGIFSRSELHNISDFMEKSLLRSADFHSNNVLVYATEALGLTIGVLSPFFLVVSLAAILAEIAQVGVLFSVEALKPRFERLNLFQGLGRLLGVQEQDTGGSLLQGLLKHALYLLLLCSSFLGVLLYCSDFILGIDYQDTQQIFDVIALAIGSLSITSVFLLLLLGGFELIYQRSRLAKRLRMDTEEFRREHRESQGDPNTRGMRRQLHQELLLHGLNQDVRKATLVVTGREAQKVGS